MEGATLSLDSVTLITSAPSIYTMADPNLAVIIFLVVLLTQVVAWIGKSVLQEAAFSAYSSIFLSKAHRDQSRLRKQVLEDKAELNRTSSQDEFAKWAKLRRKVDKGIADLEKTSELGGQQVRGPH